MSTILIDSPSPKSLLLNVFAVNCHWNQYTFLDVEDIEQSGYFYTDIVQRQMTDIW